MNDSERGGLRGRVRTCLEDCEAVGLPPDTLVSTEWTYDQLGREVKYRLIYADPDLDYVRTSHYDEAGRLSKIVSDRTGKPKTEIIYKYDEQGNLAEVTNTAEPLELKGGGLAKNVRLSGVAPGDRVEVLPGMKVTVRYDDLGQRELSYFDSQGRLTGKDLQRHDNAGRIVEKIQSVENPALFLVEKFKAESGIELDEKQVEAVNRAMKNVSSGRKGIGDFYTYDSFGRVIEFTSRNAIHETVNRISYNERGDKSEERVTFGDNRAHPADSGKILPDGTFVPDENSVRTRLADMPSAPYTHLYTYAYAKYDEHGNWTELIETEQHGFGERFDTDVMIRHHRRTLTYHH
jgi:hypothetical protein